MHIDPAHQSVKSYIQGVKALACEGMNIFDLLHYDKLFITKGAVAKIEEVLG